MKSGVLVTISILALSWAMPVLAERYSCPDGTVQYSPCTASQNLSGRKYVSSSTRRKLPPISAKAKIVGEKFSQISAAQGLWQGFVASSGTTHLKLVFLKDGSIVETRYIGSVTRKSSERPTKFKFISTLPNQNGWSWQIISQTIEST